MENLVGLGLARSIGVSNFSIQLLADMLTYCKISPAVNQIELHPENARCDLVKWLFTKNIHPVGYSPLAQMNQRCPHQFSFLEHPFVLSLASKYGRTAS